MTASDFQSFSSATKNVAFLFLHICPQRCPAAMDQPGPKPKGDMKYICVVNFTFSHMGHQKSNTNPIPHLTQLWESNEIFEDALKNIKHFENTRHCYWHQEKDIFWSLLLFPSSLKSYYSKFILTTSDFNLSLKMYTGLTASSWKTNTIYRLLYFQFQM